MDKDKMIELVGMYGDMYIKRDSIVAIKEMGCEDDKRTNVYLTNTPVVVAETAKEIIALL